MNKRAAKRPPQQTKSLGRLLVIASWLVGFLGLSAYALTFLKGSDAADVHLAHRNVVLLSQQLESLSKRTVPSPVNSMLEIDEPGGALKPWLAFDSRFVDQNKDSPLFRFEAAWAARRAGAVAQLLGDTSSAEDLFKQGSRLFEQLELENDENYFYRIEHAGLYILWAHLKAVEGDPRQGSRLLRTAADLLDLQMEIPERDESLMHVVGNLSQLAKKIGDDRLATDLAAAHMAILERLKPVHSGNEDFEAIYQRSMSLLQGKSDVQTRAPMEVQAQ